VHLADATDLGPTRPTTSTGASPTFAPPVALEPLQTVELRLHYAAAPPPPTWSLVLDDCTQFALWAPSVLVGPNLANRHVVLSADPATQSFEIAGAASARLDLVDGTWQVTNTTSTNDVAVTHAGTISRLQPGASSLVGEHLLVGSVGMQLVRHPTFGHTEDVPEPSTPCLTSDGRAWFV